MKKINFNNTPTFPDLVYNSLPNLLLDGLGYYTTDREKDIFLLSFITVISSIVPQLSGIYGGDKIFANIYSLILAPAGSGKQAMNHAGELATGIDEKIQIGEEGDGFKPGLIIPGSTSPAALIVHLKSNPFNNGLIVETEVDTVSNVMKQEWGDYSDLLRKAFQHERISVSRKKDNEYVNLRQPKLSVLLSGTPLQLGKLLSGVEDGLFSRFVYYIFSQPPIWKGVFRNNDARAVNHFNQLAEVIAEIHNTFSNDEIEFRFSDSQKHDFDTIYDSKFGSLVKAYGSDFRATVLRMGIIQFRIAMVLTAFRQYNTVNGNVLICHDDDYQIARSICEVLVDHAGTIMNINLVHETNKTSKDLLYEFLPDIEFSRGHAIGFRSALKVSTKTIDNLLATYKTEGKLQSPKQGFYKKTNPMQNLQTEESAESIDE